MRVYRSLTYINKKRRELTHALCFTRPMDMDPFLHVSNKKKSVNIDCKLELIRHGDHDLRLVAHSARMCRVMIKNVNIRLYGRFKTV